MEDTQLLMNKMDSIESNMKEHLDLTKELFVEKIERVDVKVDKSHLRLDAQSKSINCLTKYKNRSVGAMSVISFAVLLIGGYVLAT